MEPNQTAPKTFDGIFCRLPLGCSVILEKIRTAIRKAAPDAQETIKYKMPTFMFQGNSGLFLAHSKSILVSIPGQRM